MILGMKIGCSILLLAFCFATLGAPITYAAVESVEVSPSAPVIGQPITFFGMVSGPSMNDELAIYIYSGSSCSTNGAIASTYVLANNATYTLANNTFGIYNVTLTFPVSSSSGWHVAPPFTSELPEGPYSVGVQDVTTGANLCKNFAVSPQPVPEFSGGQTMVILLAVLALLYLTHRRHQRPWKWWDPIRSTASGFPVSS